MANNIFDGIASAGDKEVFSSLINNEHARIERIVSHGHTTEAGQWYDQLQNEWVMIIKGEARLEFENGRVETLKTGDYINIPAHQKHRVSWTKEETETVWLAVHY